eukprot:TRINITY_DN90911_c0_g1_i1.p1 TRINITY_DN90911_c0_g1~~TRINITY_DN90911_c0_g1_i1.p1  ORF type:complete len:444 (-),score=86.76 TRINITY_DN90911_c0_g1_i1:14-1345(-)
MSGQLQRTTGTSSLADALKAAGSGISIDLQDLRFVLRHLASGGLACDGADADLLFASADSSGAGVLQWEHFVEWLLQSTEAKTSETRCGSRRGSLLDTLESTVGKGFALQKLDEGQTGGVYLVPPGSARSSAHAVAVFKPQNEERFARRGIPRGGGAAREEAAYMLDRLAGSPAGVPVTTRASVPTQALAELPESGDKTSLGAVQYFVPDVAGTADDFGMPRDLEKAVAVIPLVAAQHLACFDMLLCNTDRHPGNLLFQKSDLTKGLQGPFLPIPIDHGCTLPRWWTLGEACFDAWSSWPQLKVACETEVLESVERRFEHRSEGLKILEQTGVEPAAQATYLIMLTLLREGLVRHGLCLASVAGLMCRDPFRPEEPSWLEEKMMECATSAGICWQWTSNEAGDRVPAEPPEPSAWPPSRLVEKLQELFASDVLLKAGQELNLK